MLSGLHARLILILDISLLFSTTSTSASTGVGLPDPPSSQLEKTFGFDFGKSYPYGLLLDSIGLPRMRKCVN
ncbi:hypothetical protein Bca4012_041812 [Brassica carinata]